MIIGRVMGIALVVLGATVSLAPAAAQTRSTRDTTTAYGARLTADTALAAANRHRVNNRLNNRLNNSINLRIERYTPTIATDPGTAFTVSHDDGTRTSPIGASNGLSPQTGTSVGGIRGPVAQADDAPDISRD